MSDQPHLVVWRDIVTDTICARKAAGKFPSLDEPAFVAECVDAASAAEPHRRLDAVLWVFQRVECAA